jgi:tRNA pseudouridine55 synthase
MSQDRPSDLRGLIVMNKPAGVTSRDVVNRVSRPLRPVKVGHAGTLDPLATGVLVIAVGSATRLIEFVQRMHKVYRTVVLLGARSDTDDADGTVTTVPDALPPTLEAIRAALKGQSGTVLQKPPGYSALKVEGRRAYDLARAGEAVDLAPRPIQIDRIDVRSYEWPRLELEIECGGGTYVRSIARDLGEALGSGGLVEVLARTRIGPFTIEEAVDPLTLTTESIPSLLRPSAEAVASLPGIELTENQVADILQGRAIKIVGHPHGEVALFGPDRQLLGIGEARGDRLRPRRVLGRG